MLPGAPVKEITLSRRVGFVRFGYSRRGTKWPGVGECPVPFVFATCLKTSPSSLFSSPSFSLRLRIYEEETDQGDGGGGGSGDGEDARSFDSTAFLPIRQTFDSFTWEPRNSSWWLSSFPSLPFTIPLPRSASRSAFGYRVHVSWPSMPLDMSPAESRVCMFLTPPTSRVWPRYPSSLDSAIAVNILRRMFFARRVVLLLESL